MRVYKRLIALLLVAFSAINGLASGGKCGASAMWELDNQGLLTISGKGMMSDYGSSSTPWHPDLVKEIIIEEGITYIGKNAFSGSKAVSVSLPSSLTVIGEKAFNKCKELTSVELPYGLERVDKMAFSDCTSLGNINFPVTIVSIAAKAFENCKSLPKIKIPTYLKSLGPNAFGKCISLKQIEELPDFVVADNCLSYGFSKPVFDEYNKIRSRVFQSTIQEPALADNRKNSSKKKEKILRSDVDINIPLTAPTNTKTFAVIISNENYTNMAEVPYSINDGTSFYNYCNKVLGIPESNITFIKDATYGNMKSVLALLKDIDNAYRGDIDVLFYYSGHGAPDDKSKEAFLVPVDAFKPSKEVCLPLDELYSCLGNLDASSVKVFLDACFSGATRDNNMIAQARSVAVVPKKNLLRGNLVVFSASSDSQTSWQYNEKGHGLFTYFLLKKLQESGGNVSLGELSDYLSEKVSQMSVVLNKISQTPSINSSNELGHKWQMWKLK